MNLKNYAIPKIIYKVLYNRLIYIGPEQIFKIVKDFDIFLNKKKALNYYCEYYIILKSIYMIFYTFFAFTAYLFAEIYIDTIEYKPLSINNYKYIIYIFERYSNCQWIFFTKIKKTIFIKLVEFIIFIENQTLGRKV